MLYSLTFKKKMTCTILIFDITTKVIMFSNLRLLIIIIIIIIVIVVIIKGEIFNSIC